MSFASDNPYRPPASSETPATQRRPAPCFGIVALVTFPAAIGAFIAFAALIDLFFGRIPDSVGKAIQLTWLATTIAVLVGSSVVAFIRRERRLWLPLAGWAITASIVAAFVVAMANDYPD